MAKKTKKSTASEFARLILLAEASSARGAGQVAYDSLMQALPFAETDFKRAYVFGEVAAQLASKGRFSEAIQSFDQAIALAKQIDWPDFLYVFNLDLANLYCHLGRFQEAEEPYQRALQQLCLQGWQDLYLLQYLNLGVVLIQQAKYGQALDVFNSCFDEAKQRGDVGSLVTILMHRSEIYLRLCDLKMARASLDETLECIEQNKIDYLVPYVRLLEGRLLLAQGDLALGFRCLEETARIFETKNDLAGKVEVMLHFTAPLIEYSLIKEAERLIEQMTEWKDLRSYPALSHSVYLRRLAISAFSGHLVESDMQLLLVKENKIGRMEDWLQFWFHLALASKKWDEINLLDFPLKRAKQLAESVMDGLNETQKRSFLLRPDIARIWRLSSAIDIKPKVRAGIELDGDESADTATLPPPVPMDEE